MQPIEGIVFDLYGTLYDVHSVVQACESAYPGQGEAISRLWRQKQLEYTWLSSLMGRYASFEQRTEEALRYTCKHLGLATDETTLRQLGQAYLHLAPHPDTTAALRRLKASGLPMAIASNGSHHSIEQVVSHSDMGWAFDHLISVETVKVFKPDNRVYSLAEQTMAIPRDRLLFVSSNSWDPTGARHFGFPVCWVKRQGAVFDELGATPTREVRDLGEMSDWLLD